MFDLQADDAATKQAGQDQAAAILAQLKQFDPIDIYKAVCSIKCAEVLTRAFDTPDYPSVVNIVANFVESTMNVVKGNDGNKVQGMQILDVVHDVAPFDTQPTAEQFATRMYMFDALILDAAKRLGIETAVQNSIDKLHKDLLVFLLKTAIGMHTAPTNEEVN